MIRDIVELGNPVLREVAARVSDPRADEIASLVADLLDTMSAASGVGIAAPQIGVPLRVFIVASAPNERYPHAPLMTPTAMINPVLEWASEDTELGWEGCLSIPGLRAQVARPTSIRVRYVDGGSGDEVQAEYSGFVARVWLHEFDHLEGIVFPDRVSSSRDFVTEKEYRRILQCT